MVTTTDLVITQANKADHNDVIAFHRDPGGRLTPLGAFPTTGTGTGQPHLPSQGRSR